MTAEDFRRLALSLAGATEGAHMGHPDFRANGGVFASLPKEGPDCEAERRAALEDLAWAVLSGKEFLFTH